MILKQEPFHRSKTGITLVELIITISIMGILSAIVLPNLSFFKKYQDKLKIEKNLIIIEDTIKQEMMNTMDYNITRRYPLMGSTNSQKVDFCNITDSTFFDYSGYLLWKTNLYDFYKDYASYYTEVGKKEYGVFKVSFTINMKDGKKFVFKYDVVDNNYDHRDYGYLTSLEYHYSNNIVEVIQF